jgi:hypothetical protein
MGWFRRASLAGLNSVGAGGGTGVPTVKDRTADHGLRLCAESSVLTRQKKVPVGKSVAACEADTQVSYQPFSCAIIVSLNVELGLT